MIKKQRLSEYLAEHIFIVIALIILTLIGFNNLTESNQLVMLTAVVISWVVVIFNTINIISELKK